VYVPEEEEMVTERWQQVSDEVAALSPEEQDRVAAAVRALLRQPAVTSDTVRPEVMAAFEHVMEHSTAVLDYLRDK
jgi:hypothetical protein